MTINGRRTFRSAESKKKYWVVDMCKRDKPKYPGKRYCLQVAEPGSDRYKLCCDYLLDTLKFETIKEAQRYVRDWEFTIQTM